MFKKYSHSFNKHFYQNLYHLAIPMALTSLMGSLLNIIDTIMISSLGKTAVAAVGSGNKVFFLMILSLFGVYSGIGVFVAQYWGKKDIKHLQTVFVMAILTGLIISTIVTILSLFIPEHIIQIFSDDPVVIKLGASYLRIVSISFIISAIIFSFEMASRSTENVKLPLIISIIGVLTNSVLNYILIFGHLGFKTMGVEGAAIATLISRLVQLVIYFAYILISKNPVLFIRIKNLIFDLKLFKKVFFKTIPVMGNETLWGLGMTTLFAAYGRRGTDALATMQLLDTVISLLSVFTMGIANSSAIMIGKKIGEKALTEAKWYTKLFVFNAFRFGIFTSIFVVITFFLVPIIYTGQEAQIIQNIQYCLLIYAIYVPFNLLAIIFIVGILRSGGDTTVAFFIETATLWGYAIPLAFILVLFTNLPIPIIYLLVTFEIIIKNTICFIRYRSGKYLHNLIH